MPKGNSEFNNGQPIQGMKMTHTFDKKEVMVPFKCDVHGWMNAYVGVLDHPYFAVTDKSGKFELKSLPPGTYTIEAWHEKLGTQTASVTLGPKETKDVDLHLQGVGTDGDELTNDTGRLRAGRAGGRWRICHLAFSPSSHPALSHALQACSTASPSSSPPAPSS